VGYFYLVILMYYGGTGSTAVIPKPYYGFEACQAAGEVTKGQSSRVDEYVCVPGKPLESD